MRKMNLTGHRTYSDFRSSQVYERDIPNNTSLQKCQCVWVQYTLCSSYSKHFKIRTEYKTGVIYLLEKKREAIIFLVGNKKNFSQRNSY